MIQRIQSIWLFLATVAIFGLFLFPYLQFTDAAGVLNQIKVSGLYQVAAAKTTQVESFLPLSLAAAVVGLLPFLVIFRYRNRKSQVMLGYATIVVIIGFSFWMIQHAKKFTGDLALDTSNYGVGTMMPSLAILFVIFAIRAINKDEKLIQSANRLR